MFEGLVSLATRGALLGDQYGIAVEIIDLHKIPR
jgi:hypothetical protein